jgi:hypothetical protein
VTRHPRPLAASLVTLTLAAGLVSASAAQAVAPDTFTLRVDEPVGTTVGDSSRFLVGGDTAAEVTTPDRDGGELSVVTGPDADLPTAVDFPSYVGAGTYPRAVLSLTPTTGSAFSPGATDFQYGAVFMLDQTSSGQLLDDGDNIFQRGRFTDPSMFKLQVDHGHPSCLLRGSDGDVLVTSPVEIARQAWYSATCSRVGSQVRLKVTPYPADPEADADTVTTAGGSTGTLTFDPATAASVGGKLNRLGEVARSTDQLNGAVAKVWVRALAAPSSS